MNGKTLAGVIASILALFAVSTLAADLDFGDSTSVTITVKAWEALGAGRNAEAVTYADKCIELYGKEALAMQGKLKGFADEQSANQHWALNDVGTCFFIKGQALAKDGKKKEAAAAYAYVSDKLGYAQCWDPNGWFWHPAEAAADARKELGAVDK